MTAAINRGEKIEDIAVKSLTELYGGFIFVVTNAVESV